MAHTTRTIRTAAVIAVGTMSAFGLAACSTADNGGGGNTGGGNAGGESVSIEYMHRLDNGADMATVAEITERWNEENPDIQVKTTKFDGAATDMVLKLETDVKAGNAPCLAQVGYSEAPQLFVKGLLEDVTAEAEKYAENFSAGAFAGMRVGDVVVGLPQDVGPLVYFYNEAAFNDLGISVPTTIEELTAESATAAASGKYISAFTPDEATHWLAAQSAAAGDTWFSTKDDQWVVDAEGSGSQTVASFWQNLLDNDLTLSADRWGEPFTIALNEGELIGHIGAAWEAGFLLDSLDGTDAEGQWRIAQLPDFGAGEMTGPDGGSGVAVLKGCEHPAEAMAFNNWFNSQIDDLSSQGLVVAGNGTPETPDKMLRQFGGQDVLAELATATSNMNPDFPYAPGFSTLSSMTETAAGVTSGGKKVADIFTTAQNTAVKALTDLGLPVAE